jgi:hypothetical protein
MSDFGLYFCDFLIGQRADVFATAYFAVNKSKELTDFPEGKTEFLRTLDKTNTLCGLGRKLAIAGR